MVEKGAAAGIVGSVISFVIAMFFIGALLPAGFNAFFNANWTTDITGLDANTAQMIVTVIPIVVIVGLILALLSGLKMKGII